MAVGQLPDQVREFARYLRDLLARLDPGAGWCGVFWSRDPEGMQACLDGVEVPPWDVVEAVLHDLAAGYGVRAAEEETERARRLHGASLAAYDARPGGRGLLGERLDMMLTEQRFAVERQAELGRSLAEAVTQDEVERLNRDLAWVRDDHERATARCAELRERIDQLDRAARPQWVDFGGPVSDDFEGVVEEDVDFGSPWGDESGSGSPWRDGSGGDFGAEPSSPESAPPEHDARPVDEAAPTDDRPRVPEQGRKPRDTPRRKGRPRGARFAGFGGSGGSGDEEADADAAAVAMPETAAQSPAAKAPRGARFAHAADETGGADEAAGHDGGPDAVGPDRDAEQVTAEAVAALVRLRAQGRSGEAHGVLVEAAGWPAARLPVFGGELHRAGLGADWSTLLWEAASLPPDRLVALADALAGAGRADDCRKLLRQGVVRPAPEIAEAVLALIDAGREREARALLDAYLRVRTPEDAAGCAHTDPYRLIPLLLRAAQGVSDECHWDLVHALRVAGFSA
ncbi:hypothetical protein ACGFSB_06180 [Streptomyces sp. NPDC048441]|uniref:hypothetical protein n=1 Tax=Streptomyces sp. NPDC048441 TaxID=3365552 RepID=UPI00371B73EE